ncbi:Uncharacterized isomerase BH0283 [Alphaproteobacteria bacterium]
MDIWVVDTFTNRPFSGNPAAVCLVQEFPKIEIMQNIAYEMNLSETTFVKHIEKLHYHIKWFTPNSEAPLCGHATIAAVHVLVGEGFVPPDQFLTFDSLSGKFEVSHHKGWFNLNFPCYETKPFASNVNLPQIVNQNPIYVGLTENCILAEFAEPEQVVNLVPNLSLLAKLPYRALIVTSRDTEYDFISRYFAPKVGIDEDPVCGSAHCRLIPYWNKRLGKTEFTAYQASKRGGVIRCKILSNDRVLISGQAVTVQKGKFIGIKHL